MTTRRQVLKWIPPIVAVITLPAHAQTSGPCIFNRETSGPDVGLIEEVLTPGKFGTDAECRRVCTHVDPDVFEPQSCITANPTRDTSALEPEAILQVGGLDTTP
jgi:hypothetical protein